MSVATFQTATGATKLATNVATQSCGDPVERIVHAFIERTYKPLRHAAKLLAIDAGVMSEATARGWLAGRSSPGKASLLYLCARHEELEIDLRNACAELRAHLQVQEQSKRS